MSPRRGNRSRIHLVLLSVDYLFYREDLQRELNRRWSECDKKMGDRKMNRRMKMRLASIFLSPIFLSRVFLSLGSMQGVRAKLALGAP